MSKPVILTGLRANNDLHLGNYLGALLPIVDMANKKAGEYQINLFVPDLHSFTTPIEHSELYKQTLQNVKLYAAAGLSLDNPDTFVYRQSFIPAHSELTWVLDCFTGMGEMSRMTQFKDKASASDKEVRRIFDRYLSDKYPELKKAIEEAEDEEYESNFHDRIFEIYSNVYDTVNELKRDRASVGLFGYPVLMAADILLYGASYVPVGDDQSQHIEFTRDIAERMNSRFGDLFVVPKPVKEQHEFFGKDQGLRIRDLVDPAKKMSKSDETGKGVIFLSDSPEDARKKIMSATTDSLGEVQYDYKERPGVSNLLDVLKLLGGNADKFVGQNQYGPLKEAVADKVATFLTDFQAKLAAVDEKAVLQKLEQDEKAMNEVANATLLRVQKAVGLRS